MKKQSRFIPYILPIFAMLAVSCGSSRNTAVLVKKSTVGGESISKNQTVSIPSTLAPQSQALLKEASQWLGTPYKYGGTDKGGVDCSGLVLKVYQSALAINLPRNSKAQSDYCTPTSKKELVPGDLLFFATGRSKNISHVGIFIGDNRMIHSSTSKGVIISDINADYYMRTFTGSGKVEKYHAMINNSDGLKYDVNSIPFESPSTPIEHPIATTSDANMEQNNEVVPIKYTPTSSLPVKKTPSQQTSSAKNSTVQQPSKPINVAKSTGTTQKEITAEDARASVLNSIIEQKLDSIYSK